MADIEIKLVELHPGQKSVYRSMGRRVVMRCGRRWGKTTFLEECAENWAINGELVGWFAPDYKILLPTYKRILQTLAPIVKGHSKVDMIIELITGGSIEFWTLNNEDAGRSRRYNRAVIDEGSLVKKGLRETWEQAIEPTLLDFNGCAYMAGTPKGMDSENFFFVACNDKDLGWQEFHTPTASNPHISKEALESMRLKTPPLVWQQEFEAEFVDWSGDSFFNRDDVMSEGGPVEPPAQLDSIFAVMDSAIKTGRDNDGTGVVYWGYQRYPTKRLFVLDWDIVQIEGASLEVWIPQVFRRVDELGEQYRARYGTLGVHIEDKASGQILLQHGKNRGWPVQAIDSVLTSLGKDERSISVSGYVHQGAVKVSPYAYDKRVKYKGVEANHFMRQVFSYRLGVKDQADDLLDCFDYGISIGMGDGDGI